MKVDLAINGKDEKGEDIEIHLIKDDLESKDLKIKISYQESNINLEELEKAINFIKGVNQK